MCEKLTIRFEVSPARMLTIRFEALKMNDIHQSIVILLKFCRLHGHFQTGAQSVPTWRFQHYCFVSSSDRVAKALKTKASLLQMLI